MQKRPKFGWTRAQTVLIRKNLKSRQTERSAKERLPHAIGENDQASPSCPSATKFPAPSPNQVQTVSNTIRPPRAPPAVENAPDFLVTTTCHTPPENGTSMSRVFNWHEYCTTAIVLHPLSAAGGLPTLRN